MIWLAAICIYLAIATVSPSFAESSLTDSATDDLKLKAFKDELARSKERLKLGDHPPPYFISYYFDEMEHFRILSSFGALDKLEDRHLSRLGVDVRVGSQRFDNFDLYKSNSVFFIGDVPTVCLENNYDALRQELWLKTDSKYKTAIEDLEDKKALLEQKKVHDLPESMSYAQPVVSLQEPAKFDLDKEAWQKSVREVSNVFRSYPKIIDGNVWLVSYAETHWFANTDGCINREGEKGYCIGIQAVAQAKDGMKVFDFDCYSQPTKDKLPSTGELIDNARGLAERVILLAHSAPAEPYRGPILFEKQAAAEFFAQTLAPKLLNTPGSLFYPDYGSTMHEQIGRRILPKSATVTDDPLAKTFKDKSLRGGYLVDDEGVAAQKITLVERGILKTLCSGRTPGRKVKESNGHFRGGTALPSQLFISSSNTQSLELLRKKLVEKGKEDGLDYVLVARNIQSPILSIGDRSFSELGNFGWNTDDIGLLSPTLLYKVYVDSGKEELIRGAKFVHLSNRIWRDIDAFGDDTDVYPVFYPVHGNTTSMSLITPSVLVSEVEIAPESHETDSPMLLPNSYFEKLPAPSKATKH